MRGQTSLLKFMSDNDGGERGQLHWGRAGIDGAPFRGPVSSLTEEEYNARVTRVGDPKNGIFDLTDPDQNKAYLLVMDKIVNK